MFQTEQHLKYRSVVKTHYHTLSHPKLGCENLKVAMTHYHMIIHARLNCEIQYYEPYIIRIQSRDIIL